MTLPAEAASSRSPDSYVYREPAAPGPTRRRIQASPPEPATMAAPVPPDRSSEGVADDLEIMMRVGWDDADAFREVMDRYWERTFRYAWHLEEDSDRAYDIAQEAFARLWEKRREWEPVGSVGGWLLRTARNLVIAEQRKRKVRLRWRATASGQSHASPRTPLHETEDSELRQAIQRAVRNLSPRRREVFTLFHLQHLSYQEIAELLDIRPQTIANHLQAAIAELRVALGPFLSMPRSINESSRSDPNEGR